MKKLTVTLEINIDMERVADFIDWLEVGLKVAANGHNWEITERKLEDE